MISTIVFDIGKVLIDYDWKKMILDLFDQNQELSDLIYDATCKHGVWEELDRGIWSAEQLIAGFEKYAPGHAEDLWKVYHNIGKGLWQQPHTKEWIQELKAKGYRLLYLSNYSEHVMEQNRECLDFLPLLDGGIFSCDVKLIKPDPAIYMALVDKYQLTPCECVFLDDMQANVEAARNCGFHAIQVISQDQARADLAVFLKKNWA